MKQDFRTKKQQTKFQQLHNIMTGQEHTLSGPISEKKNKNYSFSFHKYI